MAKATLSSKNQIIIPREARKALGLKTGDKLLVVAYGNKIVVMEKPK
jgi:AbrB family looped-hinge helix DNA binding protein